jgi:shikimate kinase
LESQSFHNFLRVLIIFVGLPGSGKTTIGRQMGRRLGLPFLDSDSVIEQRLGCSIREFFEREGEERFRDIEQSVLDDLSKYHHGVLSTGGGAVLRPLNRQNLHTRGKVVYLRSTPEEVFRRLKHDMQRPLLQVDDPQEKLRTLFNVRDPLYRETAHFVFETGRPSINRLLNTIIAELDLDGFDTHAANANPSRT